jgi:hypothetical protein
LGVFGSIFLMSSISFAQGISLDKSDTDNLNKAKKERFVLKSDKLMGAVVVDTSTGREYMRCLVGQTYNEAASSEEEKCNGKAQELTFEQAILVQKKAGSGWRLPSSNEFKAIFDGSYDYSSNLFLTRKPSGGPKWEGDFAPTRRRYVNEAFWTSGTCNDAQFSRVTVGFVDGMYSTRVKGDSEAFCSNPNDTNAVRFVRK